MTEVDRTITDQALRHIWRLAGMPAEACDRVRIGFDARSLPSSFRVAEIAAATIAASGLAASELWRLRTGRAQGVSVSTRHAETSFWGEHHLRIDGQEPPDHWGPASGLHQCGDGRWVRIHANYPHHEAGVLEILGCAANKPAVQAALKSWSAADFEEAAAARGLVVVMMRSPQEWAAHGQGQALAGLPLFDIEKIGDAPVQPLPAGGDQPLSGVRVLDLTRVIAGPVSGRTLAGHGAEVLRISAMRLPRDPLSLEIDGGRGKRSAFVDVKDPAGKAHLESLVRSADVFTQGYRPGAIDAAGFSPERLAELRPGIVAVSLSAWGHDGPWSRRRGFDSIVQTASGINWAEGEAAGETGPRPLPCQALDHGSGYLLAMGAMVGLHKRATEGGSWRVRVALARTGHWLTSLPRVREPFASGKDAAGSVADLMVPVASEYGALQVVTHAAQLDETAARTDRPPVPYPYATPDRAPLPSWS
ncbi:MAG: CoA transferase [Hyphomicrobiaceae bacterium]|nr:CoA transferase [Hyphomicrobiaceae bacterium]